MENSVIFQKNSLQLEHLALATFVKQLVNLSKYFVTSAKRLVNFTQYLVTREFKTCNLSKNTL